MTDRLGRVTEAVERTRTPGTIFTYIGIGLLAGLLSGLFGVGGGTVIVPLLVMFLAFNQRFAAGTSLAAIVPTATVGVISYAVGGTVDWLAAILLAIGGIVGTQIGTRLIHHISQTALRWTFVAFVVVVIVSLFLVIPSRDAEIHLTVWSGIALVVVGVLTGILSGLIGVGGGVVVVPVLILLFGASDLVAKGTSLLFMIPAAISGTIGNIRRKNVDLVAAACVGVAACCTTALGAWLATLMSPLLANILFAAFMVFIGTQMAMKAIKGHTKKD